MAGITTTTVLPAPVQQSFDHKLLSVPVPNMIHQIPAMKKICQEMVVDSYV
jgi:hypothetical protein